MRQFCPRGSTLGARLWRRGLWRWEWTGGLRPDTGFSTLRADGGFPPSTGGLRPEGSAALCPRELDPLERDYLRLNPLENHLRVDLRLFPPWGCLFGAADVMRASMGDAGGFLKYSSGRFRGLCPSPAVLGVGGCGRRDHCLPWDQETGVGRGYPGWSCCRSPVQKPGSESRFRIPPEPGAAAWWGEISWLPDHPGGPQVFCPGPWDFSPGISAPEFQPLNFTPGRAGALIPVA